MKLIPTLRVTRFEQLEPGDLFMLFSGEERFYALKTFPAKGGDDARMVVLGPRFVAGDDESFLLSWQASTVLSYGGGFSIVPSTRPEDWFESGDRRVSVCLAVADEQAYLCTNGGSSRSAYVPRFVNLATGAVERHLSNAVFTAHWRIDMAFADRPPPTLLEFPNAGVQR
jgi:hypothetical protein